MCGTCPKVDPGTEAQVVQYCHMDLKVMEDALQRIFIRADGIEDKYRAAGIHYHSTQLSARTPSTGIATVDLDRLKHLFEISTFEEYHALFKKLNIIIEAATEMRSRNCRYHGTVDQLVHRVFGELESGVVELMARIEPLFDDLEDRFARAHILFDVSRASHESDAQGHRIAWQDATGSDSCPTPARLGQEWRKYQAWVCSLPETQRAVKAGRSVTDVALEMLYCEPDGFEPEPYTTRFLQPPVLSFPSDLRASRTVRPGPLLRR